MAKEISTVDENEIVPAWMKEKSVGALLGNIDASDYKPPMLKLLSALSPEAATEPDAKAGQFWLTGSNINMGTEVTGTPIILRKSMVLWNPMRGESRAPLAVASDGVTWDAGYANQTFEVRFERNPNVYTWKTKRSVAESGLDKFGSSQPEDPRSAPAAALTYTTLWAIKLPGGRMTVAAVINSRSGIKPARELFSMIDARGVDHYFQRYRITAVRIMRGATDSYFGFRYYFAGLVTDENEALAYKQLFEKYRKAGFSVDMTDEAIVGRQSDDMVMKRTGTGEFKPIDDVDEIPF